MTFLAQYSDQLNVKRGADCDEDDEEEQEPGLELNFEDMSGQDDEPSGTGVTKANAKKVVLQNATAEQERKQAAKKQKQAALVV